MNTVEILEKLVGFDTTSHKSNKDIVYWIKDYLNALGIEPVLLPNEDSNKFNLLARIGPDNDNGIVLSGHTDVVPVEGQIWASDPFTLTAKGKNLYGRGSCDMKGFVACVLASVPKMLEVNLERPFLIALSYDEEVGCLGAPDLVKNLGPVAAAIVGEPSNMKIIDRHKGVRAETIEFVGVAAHSSLPHLGVSAIEYASKFALEIYKMGEEFSAGTDTSCPFEQIKTTTVNVGTITGGAANNIVPERCTLQWNFRCAPEQDQQEISDRAQGVLSSLESSMKALNPLCEINVSQDCQVPPLRANADCLAREICQQITGENRTFPVNYGTDGGIFQQSGVPTVICGPGSIEQAHKPNEFIALSELQACDEFLDTLIRRSATDYV